MSGRRHKKTAERQPGFWSSDAGRYLTGTFMLGAVALAIYVFEAHTKHTPHQPGLCPVDGRQAEWTTRRSDGLFDYGHTRLYAASHTWREQCPDGMRSLGGDEKRAQPLVTDHEKSVRPR